MNRIHLLLIALGLTTQVIGSSSADYEKVDSLNKVSWSYKNNDLELAMRFANEALALSTSIGYRKGEAQSWHQLGIFKRNFGETLLAIEAHQKSIVLATEIRDSVLLYKAQSAIGYTYSLTGNLQRAKSYFQQSISFRKAVGHEHSQTKVLFRLGKLYGQIGHQDSAMFCMQKAVQLASTYGDSLSLANALFAKAVYETSHVEQRDLPEVKETFVRCLKVFTSHSDSMMIANSQQNLGNVAAMSSDWRDATIHYKQALKTFSSLGLKQKTADVGNDLGWALFNLGHVDTAIMQVQEACEIQRQGRDFEKLVNSFLNLAEIYSLTDRPKNAFQYLDSCRFYCDASVYPELYSRMLKLWIGLYRSMNDNEKAWNTQTTLDSINEQLHKNSLASQREKGNILLDAESLEWSLDQQRQENRAITLQNEAAMLRLKLWIFGIASFLLLAGVIVFFWLKYQRDREKKRQQYEREQQRQRIESEREKSELLMRERARFAHDLHDRLGANFVSLKGLLSGYRKTLPKGANVPKLDELDQHIKKGSEDIRTIAHNLRNGVIYEKGLVAALLALGEEFKATFGDIDFSVESHVDRLSEDFEYSLFYVIHPLVSNAWKHSGADKIEIKIFEDYSQNLQITVSDDGSGIPDVDQAMKKGLGLGYLTHRLSAIDGSFELRTMVGEGTEVTIKFEKEYVEYRDR